MSSGPTKISAKEYRGYVERGEGIPALMPQPKPAAPAKRKGKAALGTKQTGRSGKYNAKGEHRHGLWFASQAQAQRWDQLLMLHERGLIEQLKHEVPFILVFNAVHVCTYRADAVYVAIDPDTGAKRRVIEDTKGMVTDEYKIKKKLMAANATPICEIPAKDIASWLLRIPDPPA